MSLLQHWRMANPGAPLIKIFWWRYFGQVISWLIVSVLYRHRWFHVRRVPDKGPVLLVCNHQSYLDLLVLGVGLDRRHFHSMARATLFRHPAFAWLIRSFNAFPVEQGKGDVKSVRTAIEKLKQGHLVLVFPEGSRTPDGEVQTFSSGIMLLIKRAKPMVVPMAVEGVYDVWPIGQRYPKLMGRTGAIYGEAIGPDELLAMDNTEATRLIQSRVEQLRLELRQRLNRVSSAQL